MKVEIENVREVKELVIGPDGRIHLQLLEYVGTTAKLIILENQENTIRPIKERKVSHTKLENLQEDNIIEGKRYKKGQKRTRETPKQFVRYLSRNLDIKNKTQSWVYLKNGPQIRYANSVVYEGDEGDRLWYSFSYKDLFNQMKAGKTILAFLIRGSQKMVYLKAEDVSKELKKARDFRNTDWLHIYLIFVHNKIRFHLKTGKDNKPIEKEFNRETHYVDWDDFTKIIR